MPIVRVSLLEQEALRETTPTDAYVIAQMRWSVLPRFVRYGQLSILHRVRPLHAAAGHGSAGQRDSLIQCEHLPRRRGRPPGQAPPRWLAGELPHHRPGAGDDSGGVRAGGGAPAMSAVSAVRHSTYLSRPRLSGILSPMP